MVEGAEVGLSLRWMEIVQVSDVAVDWQVIWLWYVCEDEAVMDLQAVVICVESVVMYCCIVVSLVDMASCGTVEN